MFRIFLIFLTFVQEIFSSCPPTDINNVTCFTQSDFDAAFQNAAVSYNLTESILLSSVDIPGFLIDESAAIFGHFKNSHIDPNVIQQNRFTTIVIAALQMLKNSKNLTKSQLRFCTQKISTSDICKPLPINCNFSTTSYYRSDGQCNNMNNPLWGSVGTPMLRLVEDGFDDGYEVLSKPRSQFPSRKDSLDANSARGQNDAILPETESDMSTMAFQILTHEFMETKKVQLTPDGDSSTKGGLNCCNDKNSSLLANLIKMNKYCMPINVNTPDPCYSSSSSCLHYIRSFRSFDTCNIAAAPSSVNFHTPYLDCELIYNEETLAHLQENNGTFDVNNTRKMKEILVGFDARTMQLPGLFLYVTNYIRLHNNLVAEFLKVKPSMNVFDASFESRKIVCGVFQKIVVDLINSVIDFKRPPTNCYNPSINPQVSLEFNIALRVMHYFIRDQMGMYESSNFLVQSGLRGRFPSFVDQRVLMDNLTFYHENRCGLTHGLLDTSWNIAGLGNITQCNFFQKSSNQIGTDLRSWDFQFGREIGEGSYLSYLQKHQNLNISCDKNIMAKHINSTFIDGGVLNFLSQRYNNKLSEIGLTIGLDFENRVGSQGILGTGVTFFIQDQLTRSICGDRFWYNHANGIFTQRQRDKINAFGFSQLLCLVNNCNGTRVQIFPFLSAGASNLKRVCQSPADIMAMFDIKNWFNP